LSRVANTASGTVSDSRSSSRSNRISAALPRIQPGTTRVPVPSRAEGECGNRNVLLERSRELYRSLSSFANRASSSIVCSSVSSISIASVGTFEVALDEATVHPSVNTLSTIRSVRTLAGGRILLDEDSGGVYTAWCRSKSLKRSCNALPASGVERARWNKGREWYTYQSAMKRDFEGHTGVIVVSSHPQSTTRPVIRPHAANAGKLDGVNDTEGTLHQLDGLQRYSCPEPTLRLSNRAWAIASLTYVGMNVLSRIITFRDLASVIKCLNCQLGQMLDVLNKSLP